VRDESSERRRQILEAVKLYESERISSGRAAEMVGMGRVEFLLSLEDHKVFPFEAELRDLDDRQSGRHEMTSPKGAQE
jgi:predicted HTH domain antitoxin